MVVWRKGAGLRACALVAVVAVGGGCTARAPQNIDDSCEIFSEYRSWYWDAEASQRRWGVPIAVQLAIIHQESKFNAKAKAPRRKILFLIPGPRSSTAYGYTQALKSTWVEYIADSGNRGADRDRFADAVDFVGWYANRSSRRLGIRRDDAFHLYLAFHEGDGGYERRTFANKRWLLGVAAKVRDRARRYDAQLRRCEAEIRRPWWRPF